MRSSIEFARLISQITTIRGSSLSEDDIRPIAETVNAWSGAANAVGINRLLEAMRDGRKIEAIKEYRALTGAYLKDSKDAVEAYWTFRAQNGVDRTGDTASNPLS